MFIFPMAGLSSRFLEAGYNVPKYMLEAHSISIFEHVLMGFKYYFNSHLFLFIYRDTNETGNFIKDKTNKMGLKNAICVSIDQITGGQAETVYLGLRQSNIKNSPITIFNIDTIRPNFRFPDTIKLEHVDGYLETFIGEGDSWSFVLPEGVDSNKVIRTSEKKRISEYCCTGIYYWKDAQVYCEIFSELKKKEASKQEAGEFYVAPMYNHLIDKGGDVRFDNIDKNEVIFCGIPMEYEDFRDAEV